MCRGFEHYYLGGVSIRLYQNDTSSDALRTYNNIVNIILKINRLRVFFLE
jgi:hypothetical protein